MCFKRKNKTKQQQQLQPIKEQQFQLKAKYLPFLDENGHITENGWKQIVELMQNVWLSGNELKVLFSEDKEHRFRIYKSDDGTLSYVFENLHACDGDELCFFSDDLPAYWHPHSTSGIYSDMEVLMRELKSTPEYKSYFETNSQLSL